VDDEFFMRKALKEAEIALKEGNWPIGCVVVLNDKIIARAHNQVYSKNDKLAHAEMLALSQVQELLQKNRQKAVLYSTYEPCPMCFGALILSRIKKVVCGIDVDNSGALHLRKNLPLLFKQDCFKVELKTGVLAKECYKVFIEGEPTKKMIKEGLLDKKRIERIDA
jgi:tRNA(adenine34) deaminase